MNDIISRMYYEAHVTIEPVLDEVGRNLVSFIALKYGFKLAELLMQKRSEDTPERSKYDTFVTGHGKSYNDIRDRLKNLVQELTYAGFEVWRYKIEDTIIDSRINDELDILV